MYIGDNPPPPLTEVVHSYYESVYVAKHTEEVSYNYLKSSIRNYFSQQLLPGLQQ